MGLDYTKKDSSIIPKKVQQMVQTTTQESVKADDALKKANSQLE